MDYSKRYIDIICNTYSHKSLKKKLYDLKEDICDKSNIISLIIEGDFEKMKSSFFTCKSLYEKAYNLDKNNIVSNCKMLEILDYLEEGNLIDSTYFSRIKNTDNSLTIQTKIEIYLRNNDSNSFCIEILKYKTLKNIDVRLQKLYQSINDAVFGRYEKVYQSLKKLYEEHSYNAKVYNNLAYSMIQLEMYDSAIDILQEGLEYDPTNYLLQHTLIVALYINKQFDLIPNLLEFCYSKTPDSYQITTYMYVLEVVILKNYENALNYAKKLHSMRKSEISMGYICESYLRTKDYHTSLIEAQKFVELFPNSAMAYIYLAAAHYYLENKHELIFKHIAKSISLISISIKESSNFTHIYLYNYEQYLKQFLQEKNKIINHILNDYIEHRTIGFVYAFERYMKDSDIEEILDIMDEYCRQDETLHEFFKNLVFVLRNRYKIYESAKVLEHLLGTCSKPNLFLEIARLFIDFGDFETAVQVVGEGRKHFASVSQMIEFADILSTCQFPMTATNYLKHYRDTHYDTLSEEDIELINATRRKMFHFIKNRKREPKLDRIIYDSLLIQEKVQKRQNEFNQFLRRKSQKANTVVFHNLRKWNSYTPILSTSGMDSVGGGFYINVKGKGIVIDPGLNFVENFKNAQYTFDDIDTILITHAHNDHTADIESILTLLYKYNSNITKMYNVIEKQDPNKSELLQSYDGLKNTSYLGEFMIQNEYETSQGKVNLSKYIKVLDFYMTKSTFKKYSGLFSLHKNSNYRIHLVEGQKQYKIIGDNENCELYVFDNEHKEVISDYSSVGFIIRLENYNLVYTGDTRISNKVINNIKNAIKLTRQSSNKRQIFLCNLGGFKAYEVEYDLEHYKNVYKNHLGRIGIYELIREFKPKLCIISEFGEEFETQRADITKVFDNIFKSTLFYPCELGQKIIFEEELKIQSYYIESITKGLPQYKEQYIPLSNVHYVDDSKGNIYYVNKEIYNRYLPDFLRYKNIVNRE